MLDVERVRTESLASELVKSDLKAQEISGDLHDTQQQVSIHVHVVCLVY